MEKKFKNEKGVSLITLGVMIVMLIIISQVAIYNSRNAIKIRKVEDLKNDIEILNTKIAEYYLKKESLPLGPKYTNTSKIISDAEAFNPNDDVDKYYVIDLRKLENISLNYGRDYDKIKQNINLEDVYIINSKTHTIYYPKGIEIDGKTYYRKGEKYSKIDSQPNNSSNIKIEQDNKDWTNGNVELSILYGDKLTERKVKYIDNNKETEQNFPTEYGAILDISQNQWVIATAKDESGNIVEKKIQVTNIDKESPTAEAILDTTKWINYDLSMKLVMKDNASGIKLYQFSENPDVDINSSGWTNLQEEKQYVSDTASVTKSGTYYVHMIDLAGNSAKVPIKITNIDKTNPIPTLKLSKENWTNQDINVIANATDDASGIKYYYFGKEEQGDNINWTDLGSAKSQINYAKLSSQNEKWYFYVKDEAGNVASTELEIGNIDKEVPTIISLAKSTDSWTQKLTLEGKATDDISGIKEYAFGTDPNLLTGWKTIDITNSMSQTFEVTENGTYYFGVKDEAGNKSIQEIQISNIDKILPTLNMDTSDDIYCKAENDNINAIIPIQYNDSESGVKTLKYGISQNSGEEPIELIEINNAAEVNVNLDIGTFYIWVIVEDNAGNIVKNSKKIIVEEGKITFDYINNADGSKILKINYSEGLTENKKVLVDDVIYENTSEVVITKDSLIIVEATDKHGNKVLSTIQVTF